MGAAPNDSGRFRAIAEGEVTLPQKKHCPHWPIARGDGGASLPQPDQHWVAESTAASVPAHFVGDAGRPWKVWHQTLPKPLWAEKGG